MTINDILALFALFMVGNIVTFLVSLAAMYIVFKRIIFAPLDNNTKLMVESVDRIERSATSLEKSTETVIANQDILIGENVIADKLELDNRLHKMANQLQGLMLKMSLWDYANGKGHHE